MTGSEGEDWTVRVGREVGARWWSRRYLVIAYRDGEVVDEWRDCPTKDLAEQAAECARHALRHGKTPDMRTDVAEALAW